jgi:hypothetical protein
MPTDQALRDLPGTTIAVRSAAEPCECPRRFLLGPASHPCYLCPQTAA